MTETQRMDMFSDLIRLFHQKIAPSWAWNLSDKESSRILSLVPDFTLTKERVQIVLEIHEHLLGMYDEDWIARVVRRPRRVPPFSGKSLLDVILERDIEKIRAARDWIAGAADGNFT